MIWCSSDAPAMGLPSTPVITSPGTRPAEAAALPGWTVLTKAPWGLTWESTTTTPRTPWLCAGDEKAQAIAMTTAAANLIFIWNPRPKGGGSLRQIRDRGETGDRATDEDDDLDDEAAWR